MSGTYIFADEATTGAIRDKYELGKEIGAGNFSIVREGFNKKTRQPVAIKIVDKANVDVRRESLVREVAIMKGLNHPNIVKFHDVFESPRRVYLVMEMLTGGELFDRIVNQYPSGYSERDASRLVRKIVSAVSYLHSKNVVHRDIKPENLLFQSDSFDSEIKLTDFGLAKFFTKDVSLRTACGTPSYVAPEVLLDLPDGYGPAVDMWSIGVVTYILLCGFPPFYSDDAGVLFDKIKSGKFEFPAPYWNSISPSAKHLVSRLLQVDPKARLTLDKTISHPWIAGTDAIPSVISGIDTSMRRFNSRSKIKGSSAMESAAGKLSVKESPKK